MKKDIEKTYIRNFRESSREAKLSTAKSRILTRRLAGEQAPPATSISKHALKCLLVNIF